MKKLTKKTTAQKTMSLLKQLHSFALSFLLVTGLFTLQLQPVMAITDAELVENSNTTTTNDLTTESEDNSTDDSEDSSSVYKVEGEDSDVSNNFMMSNIALFASAIGAPSFVIACFGKNAPSVYVYAAGAAIYLVSEIGLLKTYQDASAHEMAFYIGDSDNTEEDQLESLETAASVTDDAAEAAGKRAQYAKLAGMAYAAAAVVTIIEASTSWLGGQTECTNASVESPQSEQYYTFDDRVKESKSLLSFIDQADLGNLMYIDELQNMPSDNTDFMASYQDQVRFKNGELSSLSLDEYESIVDSDLKNYMSQKESEEMSYSLKENFISVLQFTTGTLFSNAYADDDTEKDETGKLKWSGSGASLLMASAGGIGAAIIYQTVLQEYVGGLWRSAWTRGVYFGAMSVVALMASDDSKNAQEDLENRSAEYRRLKGELDDALGKSETQTSTQTSSTTAKSSATTSASESTSSSSSTCVTGSAVNTVNIDDDCECAESDSCKKTSVPNISSLPDFSGKSALASTLDSIKTEGDSLYSGRLSAGSTGSDGLATKAARISKLRDQLADNFYSKMKDSKGNPVSYSDNVEKAKNKLLQKVNDGFSSLSGSQQAALAGMAPALAVDNKDKVAEEKKETDSTAAVGGKGAIAGTGSSKSSSGPNWNFEFDEGEEGAATTDEEALANVMAQEDQDYEIDGDINDDRNKNLFNIITSRYLKSAYPVIFEEE